MGVGERGSSPTKLQWSPRGRDARDCRCRDGSDGSDRTLTSSGVALSSAQDPASPPSATGLSDPERQQRRWFLLRLAGAVVMGIWLIGLAAYSTTIYHHGFLAEDFATYNQAWTLIGQGHLNPYDTIFHSY